MTEFWETFPAIIAVMTVVVVAVAGFDWFQPLLWQTGMFIASIVTITVYTYRWNHGDPQGYLKLIRYRRPGRHQAHGLSTLEHVARLRGA